MLMSELFLKANKLVITQADNGLCYLEPMWRFILNDNQLNILDVTDEEIDEDEFEDMLKLEVKKRNTINSVEPYVLSWVHDIITASVEPAIMQEETDYLKNLTEYLKANKEAKELKED